MPAPFHNAIKGTTSGAPGTGAFTPNAAATGFRAWSNVYSGWFGLVRYDDGSAWELSYSYWNGTTLSRASTQLFDSSTGSALSLTSAATAAMVADGSDIMSHVGGTSWQAFISQGASFTRIGAAAGVTITGTGSSTQASTTNFISEQNRTIITSLTTANAQAGISVAAALAATSSSAGRGGFEFRSRFGVTQLPTSPRLFAGVTVNTYVGVTTEPSAASKMAIFGKDSTDTNIQLIVNNGSTATKTDTGIPLAVNGWYDMLIWAEPGSSQICARLVRVDTGDIWFFRTSSNVPANVVLTPQVLVGLNGTNTGTAAIMNAGSMLLRNGL